MFIQVPQYYYQVEASSYNFNLSYGVKSDTYTLSLGLVSYDTEADVIEVIDELLVQGTHGNKQNNVLHNKAHVSEAAILKYMVTEGMPMDRVINTGISGYPSASLPGQFFPTSKDMANRGNAVSIVIPYVFPLGDYVVLSRFSYTMQLKMGSYTIPATGVLRYAVCRVHPSGYVQATNWYDDNTVSTGNAETHHSCGEAFTPSNLWKASALVSGSQLANEVENNPALFKKSYRARYTLTSDAQELKSRVSAALNRHHFCDDWLNSGLGTPANYDFEWLTQHAYYDALSAIELANPNSIQNIMAATELIANAMNGNLIEIPETLGDAWLRYRYEFKTTEMDKEEYIKFGLSIINRYTQGITSPRVHGYADRVTPDGITVTCRCALNYRERTLSGLKKMFNFLHITGVEPNGYVAWDFIPFSFIADWFVPFGDVLEVYSHSQYWNSQYYDLFNICFSLSYSTGDNDGISVDHYVRWVSQPLDLTIDYWYDKGSDPTNPKTVAYRCLDAASLIAGFVR